MQQTTMTISIMTGTDTATAPAVATPAKHYYTMQILHFGALVIDIHWKIGALMYPTYYMHRHN